MSPATRTALGYLLATGLVVGVWALLLPASFYGDFPGLGHTWVSVDGPYNEHLIRDVGAAYLAFAALAGLALWRPATVTPFAVGVATACFNVPHFGYHAAHLGMYPPLDQGLNVLALGGAVLASGWLVLARTPGTAVRPT